MFEHDDEFRQLADDLFDRTTEPEPAQPRNHVPREGGPVHSERPGRFEREWSRNFFRDNVDTYDYR
ncbi:hypothetical protein [Antrihabitans stalactiti]|uniref:Uncharacterized protein n=1 Tax=Antrihabitans stalactiti TaxID=2584121 RepID=A0A848KCN5_9NOCA|nr:hypothetical protein [Antrihabitans stalactiti]NMN93900.1 hypothetical protein [Antrihabitans stalactiti]